MQQVKMDSERIARLATVMEARKVGRIYAHPVQFKGMLGRTDDKENYDRYIASMKALHNELQQFEKWPPKDIYIVKDDEYFNLLYRTFDLELRTTHIIFNGAGAILPFFVAPEKKLEQKKYTREEDRSAAKVVFEIFLRTCSSFVVLGAGKAALKAKDGLESILKGLGLEKKVRLLDGFLFEKIEAPKN
jgi:hypothetical protein